MVSNDLEASHLVAVALNVDMSNISYLSIRDKNIPERFYFNGTNQLVNNSACHLDSLEVYRGREQAIEISHDGFSLTENGTIEV